MSWASDKAREMVPMIDGVPRTALDSQKLVEHAIRETIVRCADLADDMEFKESYEIATVIRKLWDP